jgi:hypothetical protein
MASKNELIRRFITGSMFARKPEETKNGLFIAVDGHTTKEAIESLSHYLTDFLNKGHEEFKGLPEHRLANPRREFELGKPCYEIKSSDGERITVMEGYFEKRYGYDLRVNPVMDEPIKEKYRGVLSKFKKNIGPKIKV